MKIDVDIWKEEIIDFEKQLPSVYVYVYVNVNSMEWTRINNNKGQCKKM